MAREGDVVIALAGNPNSGKTSLFNHITGSRQHVGNYPGVTVERKEGTVPVEDAMVTFVDLPGTYSLSPYSIEEHVARRELMTGNIDAVIIVVDTTRLERSLYFASQIIEIGKPVVLALTMFDEFEGSGNELDIPQLSSILGIPCVKTVGNRGKGALELMSTALKAARGEIEAVGKPPRYRHEMEHAIERAEELLDSGGPFNTRWMAINLLAFGESVADKENAFDFDEAVFDEAAEIRAEIERLEGTGVTHMLTAGRYGFASGAVAECMHAKIKTLRTTTEKIDAVVTNKWLGLPIFLTVLWALFQITFSIGEYPVTLISQAFALLSRGLSHILPPGFLTSLIVDGIVAGVGGVVVFLPNILILFFFISLLEDTGYMARAAFIMDRIMHFFGLHGKSFLPMLVGFGCTVPAIMATRILESRRERLITMFIVPFMSCGARLPVYVLLAGAFFGHERAGSVIFSIYIFGMLLSFVVAKVLSMFIKTPSPFVMELPPYRIPTPRSVLLHLWERAWMYLRKAGTVILFASILMWVLLSFPKHTPEIGPGADDISRETVSLEHTFAGRFGRTIEPALKPLGLDWRMGVALTTGFAAKEVIVSTLATIYSVGGDHSDSTIDSLTDALKNDPSLDPVKAYALMLFILVYVPCIAVLGVLRREAGGWIWVVIMIVYTTGLAWMISFGFTRIAALFV